MPGLSAKSALGHHARLLLRAMHAAYVAACRITLVASACLRTVPGKLLSGRDKCLPLLQQAQPGEAGLTCMAMLASYHRCLVNLSALRRSLALPARDLNLAQLVRVAGKMSMSCRPRRLDALRLPELRTPVILQWQTDRYVVLKAVRGGQLILHDPASGVAQVSLDEARQAFTGIVLECEPLGASGRERESWVR